MRSTNSDFDAIVQLSGGFGNQLFQYAFGLNLEATHKLRVGYDIEFYQQPQCIAHNRLHLIDYGFNISLATGRPKAYRRARRLKRLPLRLQQKLLGLAYVKCPATSYVPVRVMPHGLTYYAGLWQSPKYFEPITDQVRSSIRARLIAASGASLDKKKHTVGFHVRRGDYLAHTQSCNLDYQAYLSAALAKLTAETETSDWLVSVYSDDPDWCEANLSAPNLEINRGVGMLDDLLGLMQCEHKIISNSSFAWWAAFLGETGGSLVFAPQQWHTGAGNAEAQILRDEWRTVDA